MCIIQYYWLIALYLFISLFRKANCFIIINIDFREELNYPPFSLQTKLQKSLWKNIFLVILYSRTSPLVSAPPQLTCFPSPTTCALDDIQRLIFDNSQLPDKFTGKPKIVSHPKSSQGSLKHKSTFTFTLLVIYPSTRSMEHPDIKVIYQQRNST